MSEDLQTKIDIVLDLALSIGLISKTARTNAVVHSLGYATLLREYGITKFVDLGSGGGLPALPILLHMQESHGILIESNTRKANFLSYALNVIGAQTRAIVINDRVENVATSNSYREKLDAVIARSFAPPATTLECAIGFLNVGGILIVSEPRKSSLQDRWPESELYKFGCELNLVADRNNFHYVVIKKIYSTTDRFPRRVGVPWKRPLF
ncbi:MAG: class I SAM-dependent methyltransferase [Actinobacteria bacterium]|jgi:16S rRNA (guanine527-N7)-methyltransferase|nr:class I SAM-dependent methyltransferase [Actinomycetota bacterium]